MDWYVTWVTESPLVSAMLQFAVLGTLGEVLPHLVRRGVRWPFKAWQLAAKVVAWGVLGVIIKYGFVGTRGFVVALADHSLLPDVLTHGLGFAFALSVCINLFFGPQMMFFHRLEENLIQRRWSMAGIEKAWLTLLWFWIPAHTITFSLPVEFQLGLAALWSVVLGCIMGLTAPAK